MAKKEVYLITPMLILGVGLLRDYGWDFEVS